MLRIRIPGLFFALLFSAFAVGISWAEVKPVKIGVLAKRGAERCLKKWSPTAEYLTAMIPDRIFVIEPLDFEQIYPSVEKGMVDFILANSSFYVELESWYGANRIATLKNWRLGKVCTKFGGLIICKANRGDIQDLQDLKGKKFMAVSNTSFGGWRASFRELKKKGINPYRDFKEMRFGGTHDAVVQAVLAGKVDVGAVRTDTLERMAIDGKIDVNVFRIINDHRGHYPDFPFSISTRLYPEWPMAKVKHTSDELAEKVTKALLGMPPDSPTAKAARCAGWTIPHNYQTVHECLKELKLGPYRESGEITLADVLRKYWLPILIIAFVFAGIIFAVIDILKLNRNITAAHKKLQSEVAERKQAEEEKAKLQTKLQRAKKMEAIGTLAGAVAHDLNNVLSGLVSYPELLLMDLPEGSPLRRPVLTIQKSGEKAAAIVQDLLTLARRGVSITEVVNLNRIISEYLKSPEYDKMKSYYTKVELEVNLETNLLNILGSPVHLSKAAMNLVSNAVEAVIDEGKISISTENRYVDRPIRGYDDIEEGDYVTLTVSDTGTGISSEDIERIFEPFYTKKVMGRSGTGLGTAVVWGTVKDHKGYIDVQSTEGKGTTFTLYFPVTRQEPGKNESALSIEDYMGKGESVLVVDDVEEQREIASRMLNKLGYSVTLVSSGEEAVEYMRDNAADLLLLDMIMDPGIDGLETYKKILELHPKQKAIIASGFTETDRVKKAQKIGVGAYVKKPYTLEKIGVAVRTELDK